MSNTPQIQDALNLIDKVKTTFADAPMFYNEFLDMMTDFKNGILNTVQVYERSKILFRGHPDLIHEFSTFLPDVFQQHMVMKTILPPARPPASWKVVFQYYVNKNTTDVASLLAMKMLGSHVDAQIHTEKDDANTISATSVAAPVVQVDGKSFFGSQAVLKYLLSLHTEYTVNAAPVIDDLLNYDLLTVRPLIATGGNKLILQAALNKVDAEFLQIPAVFIGLIFFTSLQQAVNTKVLTIEDISAASSKLAAQYTQLASQKVDTPSSEEGEKKESNKKAKKEKDNKSNENKGPVIFPTIVKPVLTDIDWDSVGLVSSLKLLFDAAILASFPGSKTLNLEESIITRCNNPQHGDFQCNNAMALSKAFKGLEGYQGPITPKDIAECIVKGLPENPIIQSAIGAPNGFINIKLATNTMINTISSIVRDGVKPPKLPPLKVLIDFSSPNIAKEMHVGHLRSTIIGDSIARLLEFVQFEVMRVNHLGDWGTQFGMLITYLLEAYPNILTDPPNISDLTVIYKASKKRFDEDPDFKERSRLNVVNLQSFEPTCYKIWQLLCEVSRKEFEKVYKLLDVTLEEYGESYYNPMIPSVIENLRSKGLIEEDSGMLVVKLPHFTIPLILRKSDGGYGYDSTDMAALHHRLFNLQRDWVIIITDAGQAPHFHMCFDAGRAAGWFKEIATTRTVHTIERQKNTTVAASAEPTEPRVNHIGFGVVCGDDGKRFKTRSSETVRLIDLLNAARDRMRASLIQRYEESKANVGEGNAIPELSEEELEESAKAIGYGAVKYFDLKQHPSTDYIFNYDRMLDTRGDTAVYLMFAYARLASILRKAKKDRNIDIQSFLQQANTIINVDHPSERALAFELLQFGDVIKSVINELLPNRLCEYLKEVCVKFTDFVTKCHVLNAPDEKLLQSRLLLCEATRQVMAKCFFLLGIKPLERI